MQSLCMENMLSDYESATMGSSSHSVDTFNPADLTPEQQKMLIDIRRRKTELLLEIQHFQSRLYTTQKPKQDMGTRKNVVYRVPCTCGKYYVGQTSQTLDKRLAQHRYDMKAHNAKTGLAEHYIQTGHQCDFERTVVLHKEKNFKKRCTVESIFINYYQDNNVNKHYDQDPSLSGYRFLLAKST